MTAIAAVIALSSTPLLAQSADVPVVETPPPVIEAPPAPIVADDPLAPAPTADTAPVADPLAAEAAPAPAARKATPARTTAARKRPAPARTASAATAAAVPPAAATVAPADVTPAEPVPPIQPELAPVAAPAEAPPAPADAIQMDETMLAAGAGGLALLVLAGTGLAIRRRRRRAAEAEDAAWQYEAENTDAALAPAGTAEPKPGYMPEQGEPAFVRAFAPALAPLPVAKPAPEPSAELEGPVTELPEGFDLSRFSPNMQAAYKGPTEDNPSLSLKHRLRRASGMDQLEEREADPTSPVEAPADKPVVARPTKADFMLGSASQKANVKPSVKTSVRPVYTN